MLDFNQLVKTFEKRYINIDFGITLLIFTLIALALKCLRRYHQRRRPVDVPYDWVAVLPEEIAGATDAEIRDYYLRKNMRASGMM